MLLMGKKGFLKVAELCLNKAHYAKEKISEIPGFSLKFEQPFFKEFVITTPHPVSKINRKLMENRIIGGFDLGRFFEGMEKDFLLAVTERRTKREIDKLVEVLKNV